MFGRDCVSHLILGRGAARDLAHEIEKIWRPSTAQGDVVPRGDGLAVGVGDVGGRVGGFALAVDWFQPKGLSEICAPRDRRRRNLQCGRADSALRRSGCYRSSAAGEPLHFLPQCSVSFQRYLGEDVVNLMLNNDASFHSHTRADSTQNKYITYTIPIFFIIKLCVHLAILHLEANSFFYPTASMLSHFQLASSPTLYARSQNTNIHERIH